jgi:superoxide dismutase, Fe-Mn family
MTAKLLATLVVLISACTTDTAAQATTAAVPAAPAASSTATSPAFALPDLPYAYEALEPVIDRRTMELHHDRHHRAFVNNLNAAMEADPALRAIDLQTLLTTASSRSPLVRNNIGGFWNHSFFWTIMAPQGQGGTPSPELSAAILRDFGSMDALKARFRTESLNRFGSGWVWVVVDGDGKLLVGSTANQDNPLMDTQDFRGTPLLGNDLWEHAYYLQYQNRRAEYVDAWWTLINWREVSRRYRQSQRIGSAWISMPPDRG